MKASTVITLGEAATVDTSEQVLGMCENCGAPTFAVAVPPASYLEIDDFDVAAGGGPGKFKLQQTNDGVNWFTIGEIDVSGTGDGVSMMASPNTPWKVSGNDGPSVSFRIAVTTPGGPTPVTATLSGYRVT